MKENGVIARQVFRISLVILVTGIILFVLVVFLPRAPRGCARKRRVRLLYETNHQELLDGCKELSRRVRTGSLKPDMYPIRSDPDPEVAQFPQAILELMPAYVDLDRNGMVVVAVEGGITHCGVAFYPDDYKISTHDGLPLGNKQIIEGLWYYDDGYDARSDWKERLDSLKPAVAH